MDSRAHARVRVTGGGWGDGGRMAGGGTGRQVSENVHKMRRDGFDGGTPGASYIWNTLYGGPQADGLKSGVRWTCYLP
jgi:hypothetical protein